MQSENPSPLGVSVRSNAPQQTDNTGANPTIPHLLELQPDAQHHKVLITR